MLICFQLLGTSVAVDVCHFETNKFILFLAVEERVDAAVGIVVGVLCEIH
jgi:hypothetical protein